MLTTTSGCKVPIMGTIGKTIAARRESKGLNQSELARTLKVTPQSVQAWESDKNVPRLQKMREIATALGIEMEELLSGVVSRQSATAEDARKLALLASPRSQSALAKIAEAADSGRLTEEDVLLLEKIASRIAAKPAADKEGVQARIARNIKNAAPPSD
jgi:transcriptional regulator with XRE-family HTH domain